MFDGDNLPLKGKVNEYKFKSFDKKQQVIRLENLGTKYPKNLKIDLAKNEIWRYKVLGIRCWVDFSCLVFNHDMTYR